MSDVVSWTDIETTGFNSGLNQLLEVAIVPAVVGTGEIIEDLIYHRHVYNETYTMDRDYYYKFGFPKEYSTAVSVEVVREEVIKYIETNGGIFGGKNIAWFDVPFLNHKLHKAMKQTSFRYWDIGNMFAIPSDKKVPGLQTCIGRAKIISSVDYPILENLVAHTAKEDAMQCAVLYQIWCRDGHRLRDPNYNSRFSKAQDKQV